MGGNLMKRVIALAALTAIGFAGAAYAGSATAPKPMSDSELDKVTAGSAVIGSPNPHLTIVNGQTIRFLEVSGGTAFTDGKNLRPQAPVETIAGGGSNFLGGGPGG